MTQRAMMCIGWAAAAFTILGSAVSDVRADAIAPSAGQDSASDAPGLLWYGGDYVLGDGYNNALVSGQNGLYGYGVLESFVVDDPAGWHVTGLFSNNFNETGQSLTSTIPAAWSIRTGAGPGDFGQVLYSGESSAAVVPTGQPKESRITVSGLGLDLKPGVYYMQVSPITTSPGLMNFYVGDSRNTNGLGAAGPQAMLHWSNYTDDGSPRIWAMYDPSLRASMGVIGLNDTAGFTEVPEPGSLFVFGLVILGFGWYRRRFVATGPTRSTRSRA